MSPSPDGAYRDATPGLEAHIAELLPRRTRQLAVWSSIQRLAGRRRARLVGAALAVAAFTATVLPAADHFATSTQTAPATCSSAVTDWISGPLGIVALGALTLWLGLRLLAHLVGWRRRCELSARNPDHWEEIRRLEAPLAVDVDRALVRAGRFAALSLVLPLLSVLFASSITFAPIVACGGSLAMPGLLVVDGLVVWWLIRHVGREQDALLALRARWVAEA